MASVTSMPARGLPFLENLKKQPLSNLANVKVALDYDPQLKGLVHYDEFLDRLMTGTPAREWNDGDDTQLAIYLQSRRGLLAIRSSQVREVVNHHARLTPRHVVREWFLSLQWDGVPRIAEAFQLHWRALPSLSQPPDYLRAISRNLFIGMVARIMAPGCQLDEMVVFESKQGLYKSSALQVLGGAWVAVAHERVTEKDFFQDIQGKMLVEISEMSSFSKATQERIKSVISTRSDRFRGSYDHRSTDHPRQCVFAGTTNADDWGFDETGMRRYWPVAVGRVDVDALGLLRDQLFAEAVVLWQVGAHWWEVPDSAIDVQDERQNYDEWTERVLQWAELQISTGAESIAVGDLLMGALKFTVDKLDKPAQMRVARILKVHKWERRTVRTITASGQSRVVKAWFAPESGDVFTV